MNEFRPQMELVVDDAAVFGTVVGVDEARVVTDNIYNYRYWYCCVRDLAFERRLRYHLDRSESSFFCIGQ